jgi:2-keto-4-pentenoate hydratase/2-oxohepta-3-ene-1,7-dioic acid hydratase in catechol pathway
MRLITYRRQSSGVRLGVVVGELVVDVERLGCAHGIALPDDMLLLIDAAPTALPVLRELIERSQTRFPVGSATALEDVRVLAPIVRLRKNIFGIGLNYRAHVSESARSLQTDANLPSQPIVFSKPPTAVIGPGDPIHHNAKLTQQLDWEVELAVVIGRTATRVAAAAAMSHVFGYSVMIDISARDNRRGGQWIFSKGMDTYAPFGPAIVTADEIPDPHNLRLWLRKNGEIKQDSNTQYMLFRIADLIADISSGITLEPGDVIATGTPAGVGAGRTPPEWLWPGDVLEAAVEGIGVLRHPIVAI